MRNSHYSRIGDNLEPILIRDKKIELSNELRECLGKMFDKECKVFYHDNLYESVNYIIEEKLSVEIHLSYLHYVHVNDKAEIVKSFALNDLVIIDEKDRLKGQGQDIIEKLEKIAKKYEYSEINILVVISKELEHILNKRNYTKIEASSMLDAGFNFSKQLIK